MKYLNLGCGSNYILDNSWTNIDFYGDGIKVVSHNLLNGIPENDNSFDLVYHSHVLEHFSKDDGVKFLRDCYRVLKPGGVLRVVVPDLERIVKAYLECLEFCKNNPNNNVLDANYDWMMLELFDQMIRNHSGGQMGQLLKEDQLLNEEFIIDRIGFEGQQIRNKIKKRKMLNTIDSFPLNKSYTKVLKLRLKKLFEKIFIILSKPISNEFRIGSFRLSGEIHQWMYDEYSLSKLLKNIGFSIVAKQDAFKSFNPVWRQYNLDIKDLNIRKPDSLFIEAIK
jgi:predicted SAM-dependent methyltransferase